MEQAWGGGGGARGCKSERSEADFRGQSGGGGEEQDGCGVAWRSCTLDCSPVTAGSVVQTPVRGRVRDLHSSCQATLVAGLPATCPTFLHPAHT